MIGGLAELKQAAKRRYAEVRIEQLGVTFRLQSLTAREHQQLEASFVRGQKIVDLEKQKTRLLSVSIVDADGKLLLGLDREHELHDVDVAVIDRLFEAAARLTGLNASVEDAEKN